jgi:hypothetical protein
LLSSHDRGKMMPQVLQQRDPTGYTMFNIALERAHIYLDSLRRNGTQWIGLQFYFLPFLCATKIYKFVQHWDEFEEIISWVHMLKDT